MGAVVHRQNLDHRLHPAWCPKELCGVAVVVGDDAELSLAAHFSRGLRAEVGIEYVVADLSPLIRPLRVVMIEPERHAVIHLPEAQAPEVVQTLALERADEALG